jgi:LysM repeat protein
MPVADSSPTPTAGPTPSSCVALGAYTVVAGDTLWDIARDHCLTLDVLLAANPQIRDRSLIRPGDRIVIAGPLVAIVDTLGAATPDVTFDTPWGTTISDQQNAGPLFSLADPTLLTEIGGFLSSNRSPLRVEIRPAVDGVPDASMVLATFELPMSGTWLTVSYVAVTPGVVLPPGTYFAMFAPQAGEMGSLLGGAFGPFEYRAGSTPLGYLNAIEGTSSASPVMYAAVRILGRALPP